MCVLRGTHNTEGFVGFDSRLGRAENNLGVYEGTASRIKIAWIRDRTVSGVVINLLRIEKANSYPSDVTQRRKLSMVGNSKVRRRASSLVNNTADA